MSDWTGMGPNAPAPKLDPNCQCICHTQPGVMHFAACCSAPPMSAARDDLAARGVRPDAALERALLDARAELVRLRADSDAFRMCVNCGLIVPASHDRAQPGPGCAAPDACTFDLTPREACDHWRAKAHKYQADAQAANGVWQANLRLQAELAAAQQREAGLREAGARLLGHATQDMSEQMDAWDAFEAALSHNGRGE